MRKAIPLDAERLLNTICLEKSQEIALQKIKGTASTQAEIRRIATRILDYADDLSTSFGVIEVVFADRTWKGLEELYLQCPLLIRFKNFIPEEEDVDHNTLLVKHLIVVSNWSNALKIFKATIENARIHLMLYTEVEKPNI